MPLELVQESSGPRHYLDGRPVHAGDVLQLAIGDFAGRLLFVRVRYEWSFRADKEPVFYLPIACAGRIGTARVTATPDALLTWPSSLE